MRISRIHLQNVKRHADLSVDLAPGMTVIRGPNEAGKTTIQRALEIALFRKSNSTAQELEGVRRWGAVDEDPQVTVTFEEDGMTHQLHKRFGGQRGTVEMRSGDAVITDPAAVEQLIVAATGLPSEKFFRATASVHHHELSGLDQDEATLRDRLQQSMSGADTGTVVSRRKLEDAIRRYRADGPKNPGYLRVLRTEVERLQAEVNAGEAALEQLETERRALTEVRDRRTDLNAKQAELAKGVEYSKRAVALQRRGAEATQRYNRYKRAAELQAEVERLEAGHPATVSLPSLRASVEALRNVEYRLSEVRAELASEPDVSAYDMSIPTTRWRPWALGGIVASVAALVVALAGTAVGLGVVVVLVAAVLAATGVLTAYYARRQQRLMRDIALQNELRDNEISRRLRGRSQLFDDVRDAEREREEALAAMKLPDLGAAEQLLAEETEHAARLDNLHAELRGLFSEQELPTDMAAQRDAAAAEADECRHALAGMGKSGQEPDRSLATYEAALRAVMTERERVVREEGQAEARAEANKVDAEQVATTTEALAGALEQQRQAERRLRIYETTLGAFNAAEKATMKKAARYLEENMAGDVERITGGRYKNLRVDEDNLAFSVFSAERDGWVDARSLSQGTIDQLYLCARLGIVKQVTSPGSPPLIFDDPFVTFDDDRARHAIQLLSDAAVDHQIIFLTTSDRYDDLAQKVVVLSPPTAANEAASATAAGDRIPVAAQSSHSPE
jgi:energy-coupling factor transporter ATP-binding protein EcfA2